MVEWQCAGSNWVQQFKMGTVIACLLGLASRTCWAWLCQRKSDMPTTHRWLVKDLDHFAGFAHAIHTYLGGVALAHFVCTKVCASRAHRHGHDGPAA